MIYLYAYLASVLVALLVYARCPRARVWRHVPVVEYKYTGVCNSDNRYLVAVGAVLIWPAAAVFAVVIELWKPYPSPDTGADDKDPDSGGTYR